MEGDSRVRPSAHLCGYPYLEGFLSGRGMEECAGACLKSLEGSRGFLDIFCTGQGHRDKPAILNYLEVA